MLRLYGAHCLLGIYRFVDSPSCFCLGLGINSRNDDATAIVEGYPPGTYEGDRCKISEMAKR